jgi:hypothetical protein
MIKEVLVEADALRSSVDKALHSAHLPRSCAQFAAHTRRNLSMDFSGEDLEESTAK